MGSFLLYLTRWEARESESLSNLSVVTQLVSVAGNKHKDEMKCCFCSHLRSFVPAKPLFISLP